MAMRRLAIAGAVALLAFGPTAAQDTVIGVASVVDGDTIEVHGVRIRLEGIDAPESDQFCTRPDGTRWRCGQRAALVLSDWIGRRPLRCLATGEDRYRRKLAICFQGGVDVNRWLVSNGWALAYRRYSRMYVADEEAAQRTGAGIWSGSFAMPWDWRRR